MLPLACTFACILLLIKVESATTPRMVLPYHCTTSVQLNVLPAKIFEPKDETTATNDTLAARVRVQLIFHARNNMYVNLSHAWL